MFELIKALLSQEPVPARFPEGKVVLPPRYRGRPQLDAQKCSGGCAACAAACPTGAIKLNASGRAELDVGACLFSPDEAAACDKGSLTYTADYRLATRSRDDLVTGSGEVRLAEQLDEKTRKLFGRSLRLRSVVAGSCGGCEAELVALGNVVFDMSRFGVQFVASPRHADGIVITGAVNVNMREALVRVYRATPDPKLVIAVGGCAINGGPFRDSPEVSNGVPPEIPVDLWVPGCPPHPLTLLDGLLRLLGRLETGQRHEDALARAR
jgi:Ni,Fe-hydrogenase III small subunit/formate hydrogenlyase subunit 6/NADH:ubiquinone oxidoreductase subunit I